MVYRLSSDYSLYKADLNDPKFYLFNIKEGNTYRLNEISYQILSLVDGERTILNILNSIQGQYYVEVDELKRDLANFISVCEQQKIIEEGVYKYE